jgi:hypothetical protein
MKPITVITKAHHRNGICGAPFHAIVFTDDDNEDNPKLGIVFDQEAHCAVLDVMKLANGDIAFGSNSWRGDDYESALRAAIRQEQPDEVPYEIDIYELLARRKQVAVIWSVEDVQSVRPDLTDAQSWEVLKRCRDAHDCEIGLNWSSLENMADELFPEPETEKE